MCYWYKANEEMMVSEMRGLVGIDGKGKTDTKRLRRLISNNNKISGSLIRLKTAAGPLQMERKRLQACDFTPGYDERIRQRFRESAAISIQKQMQDHLSRQRPGRSRREWTSSEHAPVGFKRPTVK